jgi:spore germination cell wall hydrolase CwlJ-like protein
LAADRAFTRGISARHARSLACILTLIAALAAAYVMLTGLVMPSALPRASAALAEAKPAKTVPTKEMAAIEPEPLVFQPLTPERAKEINDAVPFAKIPNPPAKPFHLAAELDAVTKQRALDCMTSAIYYEAAYEPESGQRAVAQVVINRLRHPHYPKSVCGVVFQGSERTTGCQFTFTCDGALARAPVPLIWERARKIAEQALSGHVAKDVGYATHYHTMWVVPYWSSSLVKTAAIGAHIFFRWEGGWGTPAAFRGGYAAAEPDVSQKLAFLSLPQFGGGATALANAADPIEGAVAPRPRSIFQPRTVTAADTPSFRRSANPRALAVTPEETAPTTSAISAAEVRPTNG